MNRDQYFADDSHELFYLPPQAETPPDHRLFDFVCITLFAGILLGIGIIALWLRVA